MSEKNKVTRDISRRSEEKPRNNGATKTRTVPFPGRGRDAHMVTLGAAPHVTGTQALETGPL